MVAGSNITAQLRRALTAMDRYRKAGSPSSRTAGGAFRVTFNDGDAASTKSFDRVFDNLGLTMDALPTVMRESVPTLRHEFEQNFTAQSGQQPWARLAPSTIRDRARKGFAPGPILQRTGALKRHVLTTDAKIQSSGNGVTLTYAPGRNVGGVPKYRFLALGGRTPTGGRVPGRPMVVLRPSGARAYTSAVMRSMRQQATSRGLM